jgi:hypothetical protein
MKQVKLPEIITWPIIRLVLCCYIMVVTAISADHLLTIYSHYLLYYFYLITLLFNYKSSSHLYRAAADAI